jgi:glycosyltransferase involved in cell wall biosynthesis
VVSYDALRIAHVLASLHVGGAERFAVDLAIAQRGSGHAPVVVTMFDGGELAQALREAGVACHVVERRFKFDAAALVHLLRILRGIGADIIHLHDSLPVLLAAPLARAGSRAPIVAVRHDVRSLGRVRDRAIRLSERFVTARVASGRAVAQFLRARRIDIVPCGIDLARFTYREPAARIAPRILTMGRLETQKGQAVLIDAFAAIVRAWPDATLTIAGEGPLAASLAARARAHGIAPRVRFAGVEQQSAKLFADADLFCFPSLWEPQGLALLEAQASGVPVIASAVDGILESVVDGRTGVLVPAGDPTALAAAIARLADDTDGRLRMARAARAAVARWDIHLVAQQYASIYDASRRRLAEPSSSWRTAAS